MSCFPKQSSSPTAILSKYVSHGTTGAQAHAVAGLQKPPWLRMPAGNGEKVRDLKKRLRFDRLHTVCEEAACPNLQECWSGGTATVMILGDTCTRACRFCNVKTGNPRGMVDAAEPARVALNIAATAAKYIVITCVDRDDLEDGGAFIFSETIRLLKLHSPHIKVEALVSDYRGKLSSLQTLLSGGADVVAHNLETVESLTPLVRDKRASYRVSLELLQRVKEHNPKAITKSSLMVGLGESFDELCQACEDLRAAGVDIITFGQYLRPSKKHISVKRYYFPEEFKALERMAREKDFLFVAAGAFVRSSYRAAELFLHGHLVAKETAL